MRVMRRATTLALLLAIIGSLVGCGLSAGSQPWPVAENGLPRMYYFGTPG